MMGATQLWQPQTAEKPVAEILTALEVPPIDEATRRCLQKIFYRREYFDGDGRGQITLLLRTIAESEGNGPPALIEPVISAVYSAMRPEWTSQGLAWIAAFDQIKLMELLESMRALEIFSERSIGDYLALAIKNRLCKIFGANIVPAAIKAKSAKKLPARLSRVAVVEKRVALGLALIELKGKSRRSNDYSLLRKRHFGDIEPKLATQAASVASRYGERPEIFRRAGWRTLVQLASPALSHAARTRFEARILAGEEIKGAAVKHARGRLPTGRPAQCKRQADGRMAA
jgi:hypothetical protein